MQKLVLNEPFRSLWTRENAFSNALSLEGDVFRNIKNRKTLRFSIAGMNCFIKVHRACGWGEIFKNLLMFKKPILGAENEYNAIHLLEKLKIPTMEILAYGQRGICPATMESFLITKEITGMVSLEDFCADWKNTPPDFGIRIRLIRELASVIGKMHAAGMNHRDCYLCHFWLDTAALLNGNVRLTVIDLHRAGIRSKIPRRMQIKDLAGILFSSMNAGITKRDILRFASVYSKFWKEKPHIFGQVIHTAEKLYRKIWKKAPPAIL